MGELLQDIKTYFTSKNKPFISSVFVEASKNPRTLERNLIRQIERDELLEKMVKKLLEKENG